MLLVIPLRKLINGRLIKLCKCPKNVDGTVEGVEVSVLDESCVFDDKFVLMRGVVSDDASELD